LAGEPEDTGLIEGSGVEVDVGRARREREDFDLVGLRVDAHDGVEARISDPRRAVRADDDAVRGGVFSKRDVAGLAGFGSRYPSAP